MTSYPEPRPPEITHYFGVLRSQWRPLVAGAAVGLLVATGVLAITGSDYTATTDLNINVISTDPFDAQRSASGLLDGVTEAQIASSYAVAMRASEALGGETTPDELRVGAEIHPVADATIIRISYSAPNPDDARNGADAIADAYLSYRAAQASDRLGGVIDRIEERLSGLRDDLTDANDRAASSKVGTTEANQAASDRELITIEIDSLLEEKNSLDLIDTSGGSVLSTASENALAYGPRPLPVLLAGLLAGLVIGIIAAFLSDAVSRKLSSVPDVERASGAPVLTRLTAKIGQVPGIGSTLDELRTARERIYAALEPEWNVVALYDCSGQDAGDVPANLAMTFVQDAQPIHLVLPGISDERRDILVRELGLVATGSTVGGSHYATADALLTLHAPNPADPDTEPNAMVTEFVRDAVASADPDDLVIIALPPHAPHSGILAAGRLADAMAIIVGLGVTRQSEVSGILDDPALLNTAFIGAIAVPGTRRTIWAPHPDSAGTDNAQPEHPEPLDDEPHAEAVAD